MSFLFNNNLARNIVVGIIACVILTSVIIGNYFLSDRGNNLAKDEINEPGIITGQAAEIVNKAEDPTIDTADWKNYQNQWYGFEVKYPTNWQKPVSKKASLKDKWEYRYYFRKTETEISNVFVGFDIVVYNVNVVKELSATDEFPKLKSEELKDQEHCQVIGGHLGENENYPAEQVYIDFDDTCYNSAFFYTLTRNNYIYNLIPVLSGEVKNVSKTENEIIQNFPEFIATAATLNLIDIKRSKPVSSRAKIYSPHPAASTKKDSQGRLICAKKNDKPGKSQQNKKKHLDMECCLDPDEYPNPWCYYPPEKYGEFL